MTEKQFQQAIDYQLSKIQQLVRSGATELTGKTRRDGSGKIVGRYKGGFTTMFPEIERSGLSPGIAAAAIERGKGKRYLRLRKATADELARHYTVKKRSTPKPVIPAHEGNRKCKECEHLHSKSSHRFHGEGAFHRTHAFAFNPK